MINRKLLYWGVFLVAAGGVLLVAQSDAVSRDVVDGALRLWPLLVIGLGLGLLLRHTRFTVAGGMLAAAMPGLLIGGLVTAAPDLSMDCRLAEPSSYATREGTFAGAASVNLTLSCGDVTVTTAPGSGWRVETGDTTRVAPVIDASAYRLSVVSADPHGRVGFWGGDTFRVALPTTTPLDVSAEVNAGHGTFDLTRATLSRLTMRVNAAAATVRLPDTGVLDASFDVNAAKLTICAPSDLGLRIHEETTLGSANLVGLVRNGNAWESPNYASATHHADLTVSVNVGSVDVNAEGGCK